MKFVVEDSVDAKCLKGFNRQADLGKVIITQGC